MVFIDMSMDCTYRLQVHAGFAKPVAQSVQQSAVSPTQPLPDLGPIAAASTVLPPTARAQGTLTYARTSALQLRACMQVLESPWDRHSSRVL